MRIRSLRCCRINTRLLRQFQHLVIGFQQEVIILEVEEEGEGQQVEEFMEPEELEEEGV